MTIPRLYNRQVGRQTEMQTSMDQPSASSGVQLPEVLQNAEVPRGMEKDVMVI